MPIWRTSFEAGVGIIDPHSLSEQRQYFLNKVLPTNDVRVALLANELVGFIAASAESVAQLYVRVGFQRRGIGAQLLAWAKDHSSGSLWLYTFARNLAARAFYERHGFVAIAHGFEPMWQLEDIKYQWVIGKQNGA
jgi:GNAT superfamily N-acetyltransferase